MEEVIVRRIGILTSGGDAPGMNACIRAAVRAALANNVTIFGISRGYAGLIQNEMMELDRRAVSNIIHVGGTILGTARSEKFKTIEGRTKAIAAIKENGIEALILIGGDGTFRGGTKLAEECDIHIVGIPGTIDNDVYGTDFSIGFDTAVNCALQAIDRIRDTAQSHERLFFVEVMGRHTGFLALESGIAGGAEELIIPEDPLDIDELCRHLKESFKWGKRSAIVVVAEGGQPGESFRIAQQVREKTGIESRVCILGHVQRGGSPTARDRILATTLGIHAVQALLDGQSGVMLGEVNGQITYTPLRETWEKQKHPNGNLHALAELLCA
jgi:6-phosphofructokinase 1